MARLAEEAKWGVEGAAEMDAPQASPAKKSETPELAGESRVNIFIDGADETLEQISERFFRSLKAVGTIGGIGGPITDYDTPEEYQERMREKLEKWMRKEDERQEEREREREKHQAEFDARLHKIGDHEYSGKDLMRMKAWLDDDRNSELFEKGLMDKHGITREEARKRRQASQDYLTILEKERNGEQLTEEEKKLKTSPPSHVAEDIKDLQTMVMRLSGQDYDYKTSSRLSGQTEFSREKSTSAGSDLLVALENEGSISSKAKVNQAYLLSGKQRAGLLTDNERIKLAQLQGDAEVIKEIRELNAQITGKANMHALRSSDDQLLSSTIKAVSLKSAFEQADIAPVPLDAMPPVIKFNQQTVASAKKDPQLGGASF